MTKSKRYMKALRAAQSVVRGTTKHATTAATGLALITLPACSDPKPASVDAGGQNDLRQTDVFADIKEIVFDTLAPDVLAEVRSQDTSTGDVQTVTDTADSDLDSSDVSNEDSASADTPAETDVLACIESCLQPTDKPCATYKECEVPEMIPGKCSMSEAECTPAQPCPEGEECEGFVQPVFANVDENGQVMPWSPIDCVDGFCHEGSWSNQVVQACCSDPESWCEGMLPAGCTPWGPPAPPEMNLIKKGLV